MLNVPPATNEYVGSSRVVVLGTSLLDLTLLLRMIAASQLMLFLQVFLLMAAQSVEFIRKMKHVPEHA